jgi:hypothetical protein
VDEQLVGREMVLLGHGRFKNRHALVGHTVALLGKEGGKFIAGGFVTHCAVCRRDREGVSKGI